MTKRVASGLGRIGIVLGVALIVIIFLIPALICFAICYFSYRYQDAKKE